jgi:predicted acetyltransferase
VIIGAVEGNDSALAIALIIKKHRQRRRDRTVSIKIWISGRGNHRVIICLGNDLQIQDPTHFIN